MGRPKKQTSARKSGLRRSHLVLELARKVNGLSPIKVHTTRRETGANKKAVVGQAAKKPSPKKTAPAK